MRAEVEGIVWLTVLSLSTSVADVCWSQERSSQAEPTRVVSVEQVPRVAQQDPPAKDQKVEAEHPRLFLIFPTYTVADSKSAFRLNARGKWRLFVKNETDPFTFGWVAFEAGLAQANNDFPDMVRGRPAMASDLEPAWRMRPLEGFWEHFCSHLSCIMTHVTFA